MSDKPLIDHATDAECRKLADLAVKWVFAEEADRHGIYPNRLAPVAYQELYEGALDLQMECAGRSLPTDPCEG